MEKFNPISLEQPPSRYAPENSFYENFEQLQRKLLRRNCCPRQKTFPDITRKTLLKKISYYCLFRNGAID